MFTDTDRLVYEIKRDVYGDFYGHKNLFDFRDYPHNLKFFIPASTNVIGKIKFKGKIIIEFIGLKSKMYSLIAVDGKEVKKEKGVNKNVVKNIRHKEFVNALFNKKIMKHKMKRIQSKLHRLNVWCLQNFFVLFWW